MFPTSFFSLPGRIALVLLIAFVVFAYGYSKGGERVQEEWDAAKTIQLQTALAAEAENRAHEKSMNQKLNEAQNAATEREKKLRADADAARTASGGLRNAVASLRGQLPSAAVEACRATADAAIVVLGECTERYRSVADAADGHASDVKTLTEAWPE